jgi:large subunit ribosomal protein L24
MVARIKKNDTVMIVSGKDRGKKGSVIEVMPKKDKVMVKGVAMVTRHAKARRQGETPGIKKKESFISLSKVMPVCSGCGRPCRINTKILKEGKHARICSRCKEIF